MSTTIPWSYDDRERLDAHRLDYKRRVRDEHVDSVFELLEREPRGSTTSVYELLEWLEARSELVAYADSAAKSGVMLQTSCIVTSSDRLGGKIVGVPDRVLVQRRADVQFHDRVTQRHLTGGACLVGTVAGKLRLLRSSIHHSNDIFTELSVAGFNPFALFGRKLLLPAARVEVRFLGLGFNVEKWSEKKRAYLHLIWHVLVEEGEALSATIVVPERDGKGHDVLVVVPTDTAREVIKREARIDALALQAVLEPQDLPTRFGDRTAGLLHATMFDLPRIAHAPVRSAPYARESVVFDFLRLFQTAVHRGAVTFRDLSEDAFRCALRDYLGTVGLPLNLSLEVEEEQNIRHGRLDLRVRISPSRASRRETQAHWEYVLECKVDDHASFHPDSIAQCREYWVRECRVRSVKDGHGHALCVILVQGVRRESSAFAMGGVELLDRDHGIYGLRVALDLSKPSRQKPVVRVAHAIIPVDVDGTLGFLIVLPRDDAASGAEPPRPRLPGGGLDRDRIDADGAVDPRGERPKDGAIRELEEELGLEPHMIAALTPVEPLPGDHTGSEPYFTSSAVSGSSGKETTYHLHAFVADLTREGRARVLALLESGRSAEGDAVRLVEPEVWESTGLHYDADYARGVLRAVDRGVVRRATIEMTSPRAARVLFWSGSNSA